MSAPTDLFHNPTRFEKNQVALAKRLRVARKTVQRWLREPGNPGATARGEYDAFLWRQWARTGRKLAARRRRARLTVRQHAALLRRLALWWRRARRAERTLASLGRRARRAVAANRGERVV